MFVAATNMMGDRTIINVEDISYITARSCPEFGRYAVVHLLSNPEAELCLGCEPEDIDIDMLNGEVSNDQ